MSAIAEVHGTESVAAEQNHVETYETAPEPLMLWPSTVLYSDKPLPALPLYRTNSFASTSTSLSLSMSSTAPTSSPDAASCPPSPGEPLQSQMDPIPDPRMSIISQMPRISTPIYAYHSRHASVQSEMTHRSSHDSVRDDDETETVSRPSSPVSMATTFGGAPRNNHRSRTTTAERPSSPSVDPQASRSIRSGSFASESDVSHQSTLASFSLPSYNRHTFRMSLPPNTQQYSAVTPDFESDDPLAGPGWPGLVPPRTSSRDVDHEIRSTPGVVGVGEGWAGGPSGKRRKKNSWFRRRGRKQENDGQAEDPLALWTVPEEARSSPLKSAWNRSRARFGASVPALAVTGSPQPGEQGPSDMMARRGSMPIPMPLHLARQSAAMSDPIVTAASSPYPTSLPVPPQPRASKRHVQSQPHLPFPRSASLLPGTAQVYSGSDQAPLRRMDTFGGGGQVALESASLAEAGASRAPAVPFRTPDEISSDQKPPKPRRSWLSKLKARLSMISGAKGSTPTGTLPTSTSVPLQPDIPNLTPNYHTRPLSRVREQPTRARPRPVSMIPLAGGDTMDLSSHPREIRPPALPRSRSADIRSFLSKLGRSAQPVSQTEKDAAGKSGSHWKRRSFSGIPGLTRWSLSESNLLRPRKSGGRDTRDDLLAQSEEGRSRREEDPAAGRESGSQSDARRDALLATQAALSGGQTKAERKTESARPSPLEDPPLTWGLSSTTTRSSTASPPSPSLVTPTKGDASQIPDPDPIGEEGLEIPRSSSPRPSSEFAWAAQSGTTTKARRMSAGDELRV